MKRQPDSFLLIVLVAAAITMAAYAGQFSIAQDCGEKGQFRFGDLVYTCSVSRWAK